MQKNISKTKNEFADKYAMEVNTKKKRVTNFSVHHSFSSLLSDSNQRPRDYKSRALAN